MSSKMSFPKLDSKRRDWAERISRELVGIPLSELVMFFWHDAERSDSPFCFSRRMLKLRRKGLKKAEYKSIPREQKEMLMRWKDTVFLIYDAAQLCTGPHEVSKAAGIVREKLTHSVPQPSVHRKAPPSRARA